MASTYITRKCSTTSEKSDSVNGQIYSYILTPDTHEHHLHPQVKLADQVLPLEKKPKVIEVTLRTHLSFTQHYKDIAVRVQQRNNVLKALAGSNWGRDKETLLTTYLAIGRSVLSYCCPVWTPSLKDTNWSRLQRAQISALRIDTGYVKMADVTELHQDTRELPVLQHNELICQQFAIAFHLPQHPCHQLCHKPPDDRPDRQRSQIGRSKPNILADDPLINTSYKSAVSSIHQDAVRTAIESSSSKLLNGRVSPIATAECRPLLQPSVAHCYSRVSPIATAECRPLLQPSVAHCYSRVSPIATAECRPLLQPTTAHCYSRVSPISTAECRPLLQPSVAHCYSRVSPIATAECRPLLQPSVAHCFSRVSPIATAECRPLLQPSVAHCYSRPPPIATAECRPLLQPSVAHCYSRTDTAKEDKNYTGTTAHWSQPNPWSLHEKNRPDSALPLLPLWSVAS